MPSFDLKMTYKDIAGKSWLTTAKYLAGVDNDTYGGLAVSEGSRIPEPATSRQGTKCRGPRRLLQCESA